MEFEEFIKEVSPLLGLQWRSFKRRGIRRRIERRITQKGFSHFQEYLSKIRSDPAEQDHLSQMLTVSISRFFRDRAIFNFIETFLIPRIIQNRGEGHINVWSIGCASGEEPYSICLLWKKRFEAIWPKIHLSILATDINENLLERAKEGIYRESSLKEVDEEILRIFFKRRNGDYVLDRTIRERVEFKRHNVIREMPFPGMDIILCRNLAVTYFSKEVQIEVLRRIASSLIEEGYLIIGKDETLPLVYPTLFAPIFPNEKIFQKFNLKENIN